MKVLYKNDEDYIVLPGSDDFVKQNLKFFLDLGYVIRDDFVPHSGAEGSPEE